jgi:hypothetical protein
MKLALCLTTALFAACLTTPEPSPEPESISLGEESLIAPRAVQCHGSTAYYEWQCDTVRGQWSYNIVGTKDLMCDGSYHYEGKVTTCYEQAMSSCSAGGDDADCQREVVCYRPTRPCKKNVIDPPPCCIGP